MCAQQAEVGQVTKYEDYFDATEWSMTEEWKLDGSALEAYVGQRKQQCDRFLCNMVPPGIKLPRMESLKNLPGEINILLIGKTGSGKSFTANTLLDTDAFSTSSLKTANTEQYQFHQASCYNIKVNIVDPRKSIKTGQDHGQAASFFSDVARRFPGGIHAFLYAINIAACRFTAEDREAIDAAKTIFGDEALSNTIVVFTRAEAELKENTLDHFISKQDYGSPLHRLLVDEVKGRIVGLENSTKIPYIKSRQREQVFAMICHMLQSCNNQPYPVESFQRALRHLDEPCSPDGEETLRELEAKYDELAAQKKEIDAQLSATHLLMSEMRSSMKEGAKGAQWKEKLAKCRIL